MKKSKNENVFENIIRKEIKNLMDKEFESTKKLYENQLKDFLENIISEDKDAEHEELLSMVQENLLNSEINSRFKGKLNQVLSDSFERIIESNNLVMKRILEYEKLNDDIQLIKDDIKLISNRLGVIESIVQTNINNKKLNGQM